MPFSLQVDVVCYNQYLSERDAKDFEELFTVLEVISWNMMC
jgi:hypothetical protein